MIRELIVPVGIIAIIASMLVPMPTAVMDFLLVGNLLMALGLLLSTLYISDPLKLSALPSILLLATLYRLALNISTTRLILGSGDAGKAVEAFGSVVIQGNLTVGLVVFLVITLVQFIVIAKGSERVAEVSARFTLDALPGKQMSIDADVRAGLIDFETARQKRQELQTESRFYGALDGAMKFVKGDAIAGIVITAINIIGGFAIGIIMHDMELGAAASKYTLLTIGDGLLCQIPALLNSLAAGMVVTRVVTGEGQSLSSDLIKQLGQLKVTKFLSGGIALLLALVPGMPLWALLILAALLFGSGLLAKDKEATVAALPGQPAMVFSPRPPPVLLLEVSLDVAQALLNAGNLQKCVDEFRQRMYDQYGLAILRPELSRLPEGFSQHIRIQMRGVTAAEKNLGGTPDEIVNHVVEALCSVVTERTAEFVDDIHTRRLLDYFDKEAPELVQAVVPGIITVTQLTEILRNLLAEGIPVRNFDIILQAVAEVGNKGMSDRQIHENVRLALRRIICQKYVNSEGALEILTLDPMIDLAFVQSEMRNQLIDMAHVNLMVTFLADESYEGAVMVVSKAGRRLVRACLESRNIMIPVIAHEEIVSGTRLEIRASIELGSGSDEERVLKALVA